MRLDADTERRHLWPPVRRLLSLLRRRLNPPPRILSPKSHPLYFGIVPHGQLSRSADGLRFFTVTENDFWSTTWPLDSGKMPYHINQLPYEKLLNVVIRSVEWAHSTLATGLKLANRYNIINFHIIGIIEWLLWYQLRFLMQCVPALIRNRRTSVNFEQINLPTNLDLLLYTNPKQ